MNLFFIEFYGVLKDARVLFNNGLKCAHVTRGRVVAELLLSLLWIVVRLCYLLCIIVSFGVELCESMCFVVYYCVLLCGLCLLLCRQGRVTIGLKPFIAWLVFV